MTVEETYSHGHIFSDEECTICKCNDGDEECTSKETTVRTYTLCYLQLFDSQTVNLVSLDCNYIT